MENTVTDGSMSSANAEKTFLPSSIDGSQEKAMPSKVKASPANDASPAVSDVLQEDRPPENDGDISWDDVTEDLNSKNRTMKDNDSSKQPESTIDGKALDEVGSVQNGQTETEAAGGVFDACAAEDSNTNIMAPGDKTVMDDVKFAGDDISKEDVSDQSETASENNQPKEEKTQQNLETIQSNDRETSVDKGRPDSDQEKEQENNAAKKAETKYEIQKKIPWKIITISSVAFAVGFAACFILFKYFLFNKNTESAQMGKSHLLAQKNSDKDTFALMDASFKNVSLEPFFVRMQSSGGKESFLSVTFSLKLCDDIFEKDLRRENHAIRLSLFEHLMNKTLEDIRSIKGKNQLKEEIKWEINSILKKNAVRDIYFQEFLVYTDINGKTLKH